MMAAELSLPQESLQIALNILYASMIRKLTLVPVNYPLRYEASLENLSPAHPRSAEMEDSYSFMHLVTTQKMMKLESTFTELVTVSSIC